MTQHQEDKPIYKMYEENLTKIQDIERLHRKMGLSLLQPADFATLDFSYEHVQKILKINNENLNILKPDKQTIKQFNNFRTEYSNDFNGRKQSSIIR